MCSKIHLYSKRVRPYLRVPILSTQYTISLQVKIFVHSLTKDPKDVVICNGDDYLLTRSERCRSSRKPR